MKNKIYNTLSNQFQNLIGKIDSSNTQPHDHSLSWLDTDTPIKVGGASLLV